MSSADRLRSGADRGQARSYQREDFVFDPLHYLALTERKIAALDPPSSSARRLGVPEEFATLRRLPEASATIAGSLEKAFVRQGLQSDDGWSLIELIVLLHGPHRS